MDALGIYYCGWSEGDYMPTIGLMGFLIVVGIIAIQYQVLKMFVDVEKNNLWNFMFIPFILVSMVIVQSLFGIECY
tara:strand:+ start:927 stop:1154 length:228 start_codon:yes stop_codon:yes gene_type:complete